MDLLRAQGCADRALLPEHGIHGQEQTAGNQQPVLPPCKPGNGTGSFFPLLMPIGHRTRDASRVLDNKQQRLQQWVCISRILAIPVPELPGHHGPLGRCAII